MREAYDPVKSEVVLLRFIAGLTLSSLSRQGTLIGAR